MKNKKEDPRASIALKIVADIFLRSTTKFSSATKLPKLTQVDQRLKQRALAAIQSKSPQNKRINVNRVSDLGFSPLFQGLDLVPDRNKKSSGNQQRHQPLSRQSPLKPQNNFYNPQHNIETDSKEKQQSVSPKKALQRQHNRNPQNQLNNSRSIGDQKQVKGNIVSQNLHRNQKAIRDDFNIGDKSLDRRRKYSNQNNTSLVQENKIMTQNRAKSSPKQKKTVSFSPQKPIQHLNPVQNKVNQIKLTNIQNKSNQRQQTYVYVPPKRMKKEETFLQLPIQSQTHLPKNQFLSQKKIQTQPINTSNIRKPIPKIIQPIIQRTPRPIQKNPLYRPNAIERNSQFYSASQKQIQQTKISVKESNLSIKNSLIQKISLKDEKQRSQSPSKRVQFTEQDMRQDWSKIKQTLQYNSSLIPQKIQSKNVSEREDVALKMIAQLFLDASTRYFPGLSMLLNRGISKQDIENIRSKSSQFKINIFGAERKSAPKLQPKTQRRLNWKDNQSSKRTQRQNSTGLYKSKMLEEIKENRKAEQMETSQSQSRIQVANKFYTNIQTNQQKKQKNTFQQNLILITDNKNFTRRQNILKTSPEVLKSQKPNQTLQSSRNQDTKIKNETKTTNNVSTLTNKQQTNYVYQPPVRRQQTKESKNQKAQTPTVTQKTQSNTSKPVITTKTSIESIQSPIKNTKKSQTNQNNSSQQLISSKSTSIGDKKNFTSGQNTLKNSDTQIKKEEITTKQNSNNKPIKPLPQSKIQNKMTEQVISQKNISLISSKSQTSLLQPSQETKNNTVQQKKSLQTSGYVYQSPSKKDLNYVYQPPNMSKKNSNIVTQQPLPVKNQNSNTLRNIKSQKTIKTIETNTSNKKIQSPIIKNGQKVYQKVQSSKQIDLLTKKGCSLLVLIIKKLLNLNFSNSFVKINQQSKIILQNNQHVSYFSRQITSFTINYEYNLKTQAFRKLKTSFVSLYNKNSQLKKISQENSKFLTQRKENIARIIFLILKNKFFSYLEPIKLKSQKVRRKAQTTERISSIIDRILKNKTNKNVKEGFNKIKLFSSFKKATLQQLSNIVRKLNYKTLSDYFTSFLNKSIKQKVSKVPNIKVPSQTLIKSKSQEVISSSKSLISSGCISSIQLSTEDQKKIATKQKQFNRKINDQERRRQNLHQELNQLNKNKRAKNKKNSDLKTKIKEIQKQQSTYESSIGLQKSASKQHILSEDDLIPILTKAYAYLFEDPNSTNVSIERFLADNQSCFQLPTNSTLLNEWKVISRNAELKSAIKVYEGQQPREKQIYLLLKQQNTLMAGLLRSFIRERYIWEWVNIIARQ